MTPPPPAPRRGPGTVLFTVLAIAIAATVGWFVQKRLSGQPVAEVASAPAEAAAGAPAAPPAEAVPVTGTDASLAPKALPEVLPAFELKDRDGKLRRLAEWTGQPLIVNYWATWCAPCVREIPLLSQLRRERSKQKLEVIGIAVDFRDDVLKFADSHALDYPLLIGEEEGLAAVSAVGMQPAFPFTLFADSQQRIVAMKIGELHRDEATLILDRVAAVDAGTLALDQAREQIREGLKDLATQRALEGAKPAEGKG